MLEAARDLGVDNITIQAVADRLEVTRSAVYHYVDGVEQLRRLTAARVVGDIVMPDVSSGDWKVWLRALASALRTWRLAHASEGQYVYLGDDLLRSTSLLDLGAQGVEVLERAGFGKVRAGEAMHFLFGVIWINTHDEILAMNSRDGRHPQAREFEALSKSERAGSTDAWVFADFDARFERELDWVIAGLEAELTSSPD